MVGNTLQDALFLKTARFFSKPALKAAATSVCLCERKPIRSFPFTMLEFVRSSREQDACKHACESLRVRRCWEDKRWWFCRQNARTHSPGSKQTDSNPSSRLILRANSFCWFFCSSSESHQDSVGSPRPTTASVLPNSSPPLHPSQSHPWFLLRTSCSSSFSSRWKPLSFAFFLPLLTHFPVFSSSAVKNYASRAAPLCSLTFTISPSGSTDLRNRNTSQWVCVDPLSS